MTVPTLVLPAPVPADAGCLDVASVLRRAAVIEAEIRTRGWAGGPVAFAFGRDEAAFAAALLGCWRAGCHALLPADARRELVGPLLGPDHDGPLIHDTGVGRGIHAPSVVDDGPSDPATGGDLALPLPVGPALSTMGYERLSACEGKVWDDAEARPAWLQPGLAALAGRTWSGADVLAEIEQWRTERTPGAIGTSLAPSAQSVVFLGLLAPLACGLPVRAQVHDRQSTPPAETLWITSPAHRRAFGGAPCVVTMEWGGRDGDALAMTPESRADEARLEVAARCAAIDGVEDVALVPADGGGWRAAARVTGNGRARGAMAQVEGVAEVLVVDDLGRDPNGLLPDRMVHRLFGRDAQGRPLEREFAVTESAAAEGESIFSIDVPSNSAWYDGHFRLPGLGRCRAAPGGRRAPDRTGWCRRGPLAGAQVSGAHRARGSGRSAAAGRSGDRQAVFRGPAWRDPLHGRDRGAGCRNHGGDNG